MPYQVDIAEARADFPQFAFIRRLTPSEQKCAFHVRDKSTGQELCLKLIAPDYSLDRLNREVEALQGIHHPNIVRFIEYTYSSRPNSLQHYIIEDFVGGTDLTEELVEAPWDLSRAADFFSQVASALETLRKVGVVHRDLKPANIRVRPDGSPVLIDFGLARHLSKPDLTKTEAGAQIGTPLYFAPEQFRGTKRDIDSRTDLFAVGLMLYQALIGEHPFATNGTTWADLEAATCAGLSPKPAFESLPPRWKLIIRRLLAVERARRINTPRQLEGLLKEAL